MVRIAAVADLHFTTEKAGQIRARFEGVEHDAGLLLLPGDLTDHGTAEEAELLAAELSTVPIPVLAVLGNHDFAARATEQFRAILARGGIAVLDGTSGRFEVGGVRVGVAGVRGFMGGFGEYALGDTTEAETEAWVLLAQAEARKLDIALAELDADLRIAMTHYAPIRGTIAGEHPETFAFYGSSRLLGPIERHMPNVVVHGHAHNGSFQGRTAAGIPVYNVSAKVIGRPYAVLEVGR